MRTFLDRFASCDVQNSLLFTAEPVFVACEKSSARNGKLQISFHFMQIHVIYALPYSFRNNCILKSFFHGLLSACSASPVSYYHLSKENYGRAEIPKLLGVSSQCNPTQS